MVRRVAVTGGGGQIAYTLLFAIASGALFGKDHPIILQIKDLKEMMPVLEGVKMELEDGAFPLLKEIKIGYESEEIFADVDVAFLVGAKPRTLGMERKDLLMDNGKIFVEEGKALNKAAKKEVKVLVVGNPCNTNCLIAMHHAKDISRQNFYAMMTLDEHRSLALLAKKANCAVKEVINMTIWGNHSSTQVPDFTNALIQGKKAEEVIKDRHWLQNDFIKAVQNRGASIIAARGKSSAASAAYAALAAIRSLFETRHPHEWFTTGVCSDQNPYGIVENLIFGFPCHTKGTTHEIVKGVLWDDFISEKIKLTTQELIQERECVKSLL